MQKRKKLAVVNLGQNLKPEKGNKGRCQKAHDLYVNNLVGDINPRDITQYEGNVHYITYKDKIENLEGYIFEMIFTT